MNKRSKVKRPRAEGERPEKVKYSGRPGSPPFGSRARRLAKRHGVFKQPKEGK